MSDNRICKIDSIENLRNLIELDCNRNKIRQIDTHSFSSTNPIRILRLEENGLRSLTHINKLHKLQSLFLGANRLTDIMECEKLQELTHLVELLLLGNPLTRKNMYRHNVVKRLPTLMYLDGKEINQEERERVELAFMQENKAPPMVHYAQMPNKVIVIYNTLIYINIATYRNKRTSS